MTAESRRAGVSAERVAAVLAEHEYQLSATPSVRVVCACDFWRRPGDDETLQDVHRAHVAAAVLDALGTGAGQAAVEALAEAWDAGAQAATDWISAGAWLATMPENPHRAAVTSADDATPSDQGGNEAGEGVGG